MFNGQTIVCVSKEKWGRNDHQLDKFILSLKPQTSLNAINLFLWFSMFIDKSIVETYGLS